MEQNVFSTVAYYIQIGITVKAVFCVVKHFDTASRGKVTWGQKKGAGLLCLRRAYRHTPLHRMKNPLTLPSPSRGEGMLGEIASLRSQ